MDSQQDMVEIEEYFESQNIDITEILGNDENWELVNVDTSYETLSEETPTNFSSETGQTQVREDEYVEETINGTVRFIPKCSYKELEYIYDYLKFEPDEDIMYFIYEMFFENKDIPDEYSIVLSTNSNNQICINFTFIFIEII